MKLGNSWEVTVKVDGVALEEFQPECTEGGTHVTAYVPSEAGKVYSKFLGLTRDKMTMLMMLYTYRTLR